MSTSSYIPPHLRTHTRTNKKTPVTRYKTLVIPRTANKKYIVVTNSNSGEITFIGGGCKTHEKNNLRNCALRELREEAKNSIPANRNNLKFLFNAKHKIRSNKEKANNIIRGLNVTTHYNVYGLNLKNKMNNIKKRYNKSTRENSSYKETKNILKLSRKELNNVKMWNVMRNYILPKLN